MKKKSKLYARMERARTPMPAQITKLIPALWPKTAPQSVGVFVLLDTARGVRKFTGIPCMRCCKTYTIEVQGQIVEDIDCPVCGYPSILKKDLSNDPK